MTDHGRGQLYFAYGSNLCPEDFTAFCVERGFAPDCLRSVGTATLRDEELVFNRASRRRGGGVINIRSREGRSVQGVLFEPTEEGWRALDRKEGHPTRYRREVVRVALPDGSSVEATTYRGQATDDFVEPTADYLDVCRRGREAYSLDPRVVDVAARLTGPGALFVYGSMMRGQPLWRELAGFRIECCLMAKAYGSLRDHGAYPGFVPGEPGDELVAGEFIVFEDIEAVLAVVDRIEGFHVPGDPRNRFERVEIHADAGRGRGRPCQVYATRRSEAPVIEGGDWRAHQGIPASVIHGMLVAAHRRIQPDLLNRLTSVPLSPFASVLEPGEGVYDLVRALVDGGVSELDLCRGSDCWAVVDLEGEPAPPAVLPGVPTRGPAPTSWSREVTYDPSGPGFTYVFRYGARDVWKIGWCDDVAARLRDVDRDVPSEVIGEGWSPAFEKGQVNCARAYVMEQTLLRMLTPYRTFNERVVCSETIVREAWIAALGQEPAA